MTVARERRVGEPWTVPATDAPWDHEMVSAGDVALHVVTAGPEDGDLVVLLHGFPEFWYAWRRQLGPLAAAGYRVVAPDLRGYNRSEKPDAVAAYTQEALVGDVAGLVRAFDRERAHLVGHDWGGLLAWATAFHRPDLVDRLAILNAPHPGAYERELFGSLRQLRKSWYVGFFQLPELPERAIRARDYAAVERLLEEEPTRSTAFTERDIDYYTTALDQPGALSGALNYYRAAGRRTVGRLVSRRGPGDRRVAAPTLLVWGDQDSALSVSLTEDLDQWVPDLRVAHLPAASHWVQQDEPERVAELLRDHLP